MNIHVHVYKLYTYIPLSSSYVVTIYEQYFKESKLFCYIYEKKLKLNPPRPIFENKSDGKQEFFYKVP